MDYLLIVALTELVKSVVRHYVPDAPDWCWPVVAIAFGVGLAVGQYGLTWQAVMDGLVAGLTVTGLYKASTHLATRIGNGRCGTA